MTNMLKFMRLVLLTLILPVGILFAQDQMRRPGMASERIEQLRKVQLMDALQMDEETAIKFFAKQNKHQAEMRELDKKRNDLIDILESMRKRNAEEVEYAKIMRDIRNLGANAYKARELFLDEISKQLTQKQFADYIVFERKFMMNLREMMQDVQRERMQQRRMPR